MIQDLIILKYMSIYSIIMNNKIILSLILANVLAITGIITPPSSYAQHYVATLSGKDMVPPVNTHATGIAALHINPNGAVCYSVNATNITGVLGAHIGYKNGTELASLLNPYAVINTQQVYPTGPVNGQLTSGDIKAGLNGPPAAGGVISPSSLTGPLVGKNVSDLDKVIKSGSAYVTVRTLDHQRGEIQGQIVPSNSNTSCLTTMRYAPPTTTINPLNTLGLSNAQLP
jgi:CHRD domain-containing protein